MRVQTVEGEGAFVHGAGFFSSDEEFARTFVPFCERGLDDGEPTVVQVERHKADLLRDALGERRGLTFLSHEDQYATPPDALAGALATAREHTTPHGRPFRLVGELPPLTGLSRDTWLRYEVAANRALRPYPILAVCPFDSRTLPTGAREQLLRIHHVVLAEGGRTVPTQTYEAPEEFFANGRPEIRDPLEAGSPALELADPTPIAVRAGLVGLARAMHLDGAATDALLVSASEIVTNATVHGVAPVLVRVWASSGRIVVSVHDRGRGPRDPFTGLFPAPRGGESGRGLWIAHQLCPELSLATAADGFTVRLAVGAPEAASMR